MTTPNHYAEARRRFVPTVCLREETDEPSEQLLQAIWLHQRLMRDKLTTLDGRRLEVLHPGFWNREAGPDFRGAVFRLDGELVTRADVEIDLHSSGWKSHGHDRNPAFGAVALHVVWEGQTRANLPTVALKNNLDAPLSELSWCIGRDGNEPPSLSGQCSAPLRDLADVRLAEVLTHAAMVRFESKARLLQSRARQAGWEQALWEGLFRGLGYKHNVWPMQCLAERRAVLVTEGAPEVAVQARLLGLAGLLPADTDDVHPSAVPYVRELWDVWWRERDACADNVLPKNVWRFHGLRPANHPQRRLALAAHWLARRNFVGELEGWCATPLDESEMVKALQRVLHVDDEVWCKRWTLRSARLKSAQPMLGPPRLTDLAINTLLPWLWSRAAQGRNEKLQTEIQRRFLAWPASEDNVVLKLARRRLLNVGGARRLPARAAVQQGLLQIVRDFCEQSDALCTNCRFPELVRAWPR